MEILAELEDLSSEIVLRVCDILPFRESLFDHFWPFFDHFGHFRPFRAFGPKWNILGIRSLKPHSQGVKEIATLIFIL